MGSIIAAAGGGNWTAGGTWVGGVAPTAADDALLTAASGNVTIDAGAVCRSLDCNTYTSTLTHTVGVTLSIGDGTAGAGNRALRLVAGMTYTPASINCNIDFATTSATVQTVDFAGKTMGNANWTMNGGSLKLISAYTSLVGSTITLSRGTLDTNGQTCSWGFFSSTNSNVRTLTLGASTITITGSSGTHWDFGVNTNLTFNCGTSNIIINNTSTWAFAGGDKTYNNLTVNLPGGVGCNGFSGSNTFANLTISTAANTFNFLSLFGSTTQTITNTLTLSGNSVINRLWVVSGTLGSTATLNAANVVLQNADFMDITGAGAATWSGTSLGNGGGNSGITFATPRTLYRVGAAGAWTDTTKWSLSSGGATGIAAPLCQDDVNVDSNASGNITAVNLTTFSPLGKSLNWTGFAGTFGIGGIGNLRIFGSLTLSSSLTMGGIESLQCCGRGSFTITSAGKTFGSNVNISAPTGTYSLLDALSTTSQVGVESGNFISNGFAITCSTWSGQNTNFTRSSTLGSTILTMTSTAAGNTFSVNASHTMSAANATIVYSAASANARNFIGGSNTYGTLTYTVAGSTGKLTISGNNTINTINFSDSTNARTLELTAGSNTTFTTLNMIGASGRLLSITSTTTTNATLTKTSGIVSLNWVNISDSTATGGAYFAAGANSVDAGGGNSGWVFGAANFPLTAADSLSFSDLATRTITRGLSKAETLSLSDAVVKTLVKNLADTISFGDSPSKTHQLVKADTISFSDSSRRNLTKVTTDIITLTDQILTVRQYHLAPSDSISFSDSKRMRVDGNWYIQNRSNWYIQN